MRGQKPQQSRGALRGSVERRSPSALLLLPRERSAVVGAGLPDDVEAALLEAGLPLLDVGALPGRATHAGLAACLQPPTPAGVLRALVLAYMDPKMRPEVVRRWGPLSFFATSAAKVESLDGLLSPDACVSAVRAQHRGALVSLLARATEEDIAAAALRLPLFSCMLAWATRS